MNEPEFSEGMRDGPLYARFQAAAAREHRCAARVLRELMACYVDLQGAVRTPPELRGSTLERLSAVSVVLPVPAWAAPAPADEPGAMDALAARQHGWHDDGYRREARD